MTVVLNCTTNVLKENRINVQSINNCLTSIASVPGKDQGGLQVKVHVRARERFLISDVRLNYRPAIGAIWEPCFHPMPATDRNPP